MLSPEMWIELTINVREGKQASNRSMSIPSGQPFKKRAMSKSNVYWLCKFESGDYIERSRISIKELTVFCYILFLVLILVVQV